MKCYKVHVSEQSPHTRDGKEEEAEKEMMAKAHQVTTKAIRAEAMGENLH